MDRDVPLRVDERELAHLASLVLADERRERLGRAHPRPHEREAARAVVDVGEGLRRHHADSRLGPGHEGTHGKRVRVDGDPDLPRVGIAGGDGIRVGEHAHAVPRVALP